VSQQFAVHRPSLMCGTQHLWQFLKYVCRRNI
jgi:hypothetical protein